MPISNWWNRIISWFQDRNSRNELIRDFNKAARESFVMGLSPVIMEASISKGEPAYRHAFSKTIGGTGFRIKAMTGMQLSKDEIVSLGTTILSNDTLVRRLVVLGWDTLEIHCDTGIYGCRWQLRDYMLLNSNID